jgi:membrane-associated protease RseP (regulator of RpoE activity)
MPGQVSIGKLEVGGVTANDLQAIVLDHPTVSAIAEMFGPIEGIVGFPFFARYRTSIDYQAKQFTFTPNGYKPADVMQSLMTTLMTRSRDRGKAQTPRMLVPSAQWGLRFEKGDSDTEPGVLVAEVMPDSAAAQAGVQVNDRLLTLDGHWTDSIRDVFAAAGTVKAGQTVELRL